MLRSSDLLHVHLQSFFARKTEDLFSSPVDRDVVAFQIVNINYVVRILEKIPVAQLAFFQIPDRALSISDVLPHHHSREDRIVFFTNRKNVDLKPAFVSAYFKTDRLAGQSALVVGSPLVRDLFRERLPDRL